MRQGDLVTFKGIPYAGPVSGANRFKAPPPLVSWTSVRDAFTPGPPSFQPSRPSFGAEEPFPSEDCLVLNIWTPAVDQRRRPVMFYNHGGGFVIGSGNTRYQDGSNLARLYDVVVVASNHRLGLLGYLFLADLAGEEYATSGNQGILDIAAALKWLHENIEAFGGDPHNVMVFGESGGGAKTSCIHALPTAKDYFNKASIESGPGVHMSPRDVATETAKMVLTELGLTQKEVLKLKEIPPEKLVEVQGAVAQKRPGGMQASPNWFGKGSRLWIDLGDVKNLAAVTVNGKKLGETWHPPYRVDATTALKPGANQITIEVVNAWVNRLIGDEQPGATKLTFADVKPYKANSPLLPSGLLGPVKVIRDDTH
jgi:carboxylesterase type B